MQIESYNIKGERCSGTNYFQKLIETNLNIPLIPKTGWKHGYCFGPTVKESTDFLTVVIFRNIYDWLRSFYLHPWHLPGTISGKWLKECTFSEFIRMQEIKAIDGRRIGDPEDDILEDRHPLHLSNPKSIFELRKWKAEHFLNLPNMLSNVYCVNYEDLVKDPEKVIDEINSRWFGKDYEFQNWTKYKASNRDVYVPKTYFEISAEDRKYINKNTDWKVENKLGYFKVS